MKMKIIILTLVFLFAGSAVLGLTWINMTKDEAYDAAVENNAQFEIDDLNLELKEITHEKNLESAAIPTLNSFSGQLVKLYNPFVSETNLEVEKAKKEKSYGQLEIDIFSAAVSLDTASVNYDDAQMVYNDAKQAYNDALKDPTYSSTDKLTMEYNMESAKISLQQAENTLENAQRKLDNMLDVEGAYVLLPKEYSDPYQISLEDAYEKALKIDIGIYQAMRNAEAADIKFNIASKYYNEDEDMYISALAGLKNSELTYDKELLSLEMSIRDDIDNLKNKFDSIALAQLNKKIKSGEYDAASSQYKAGIIAPTALENAENAYIASVKQLDVKINDYILLSMRFTLDYGYNY